MKKNELERQALGELKGRINKHFPHSQIIMFGSKARGDDTLYSDIDILVLIGKKISTHTEKQIFDVAYDVGLKYSVVFGVIVEQKSFWNSLLGRSMPIYKNILHEGIVL
ncbi:MAG: hypothetical protein A2219_07030 [Elusimicrobia bacterium RIFOXYA2_FULL_50_26]|nr:MAG: hypothetical protein A2219_07030 [Elusimicrobia bacterium RIFOXYA2_FULL_50_26]OGS24769.1 MAG: hypothetical protein A2314_05265 [Elusimicrobia bacterium RIFOXYB2_FULL_50_12]